MVDSKALSFFGLAFYFTCFGILIGIFFFQKISQWRLKSKLNKRFEIAALGEKSALELLHEHGYVIEKVQKVFKLSMWINDQKLVYDVRPDAFVVKEGKKYLVEVKTGKEATDPKSIATRRQLFEYFHGFDVEGVLFIDAIQSQIYHIQFPKNEKTHVIKEVEVMRSKKELFWAFLLGACFTYLIVMAFKKGFYG